MAFNKADLRINVRGENLWIRKLRAMDSKLSSAQQETGIKLARQLKEEAQAIIAQKAPNSSGNLRKSLVIEQNKTGGAAGRGWHTKVTTDVPYADKVESGHPPEFVQMTRELENWIERVLGQDALQGLKNKEGITVRKGNNPRYDTGTGMRFFQIPFQKNVDDINRQYQEEVKSILNSTK